MDEARHPEEESLENKGWCWTSLPEKGIPPCARSLHTGVVHDDNLYIFGGYDGIQRTNDFYKFNLTDMKWSLVHSDDMPPSPRDRHVTVSLGRCIYIYGGYDGSTRVNDFYEFNADTKCWREVIPTANSVSPSARHSHSAVVYEGCMYVFAGYDGLYRNDFHRFCFATNTWKVVTDSQGANEQWPKARYRTTATVVRDKMYVFGGHDGSRQLNDFYAWSFTEETWTEIQCLGSPPSPRDSHVAVPYKNSLYIFGGSTGNARSDFYEYRIEEQRWVPICNTAGIQPCSRFCHIGSVHGKCFYIFGGYDGVQRLNDLKRFRFEPECYGIPSSTLAQDLRSLVNNELFSDVTFIVEGKKVFAHKLLLCRNSYFLAMFSSQMMEGSSREIQIPDVSYASFLCVLRYLYTDQADLSLDNAMEIFIAADRFCIERLKRICEKTILNSIDLNNVASIFQAADLHGACALREAALRFLLSNFDAVSKTTSFIAMARSNVELVLEILAKR